MTENTPSEAMVEAMARAIYEADDPWHVAWPWPDLQSDQAGVDHYRRCAEAAAAVVQAGLDDRVSTSSPVDDSGAGNMSVKPDIEAAVKSDTAPVSDKLVEAIALWERADRAGEDAYVEAVQIGVDSADDAHKCSAIAAAAVIADALAERDARIKALQDALFDATAMIGHNLTPKATALIGGRVLNAHDVWKAGSAALGSAKV